MAVVKDETHSASFTAGLTKALLEMEKQGILKKKYDRKTGEYNWSFTKKGKEFAESETFKTMMKAHERKKNEMSKM